MRDATSAGHHGATRRPVLEALTGLRFVAALAVVCFHLVPRRFPGAHGPGMALVRSGYVGVSLFFVLSGFVLTYNYLDPSIGKLRGTARAFWWARVARVYPVYLLALAFSLPEVVRPLVAPRSSADAAHALAALPLAPTLLQSWSPSAACAWNCPGWSLSVEAFFYLLFPVLCAWLARRDRRSVFGYATVAWVLGLLAPALYLRLTPDGIAAPTPVDVGPWLNVLKFNPLLHLPEFLIGIATGIWFVAWAGELSGDRRARALGIRVTAGLAVGGVGAVIAFVPGLPFVFLHAGLLAPVWALAVFALALGRGPVAAVLGSRPLVRLGEASYALYLFHSPLSAYVQMVLDRILQVRLTVGWELAVHLAVALAVSLAVYQWVERPVRDFLRHRANHMRPVPRPAASA